MSQSNLSSLDFNLASLEEVEVYDPLWDNNSENAPDDIPPSSLPQNSTYEMSGMASVHHSPSESLEITTTNNNESDVYKSQCDWDTTAPDITEWTVVSVDKVNDIVPFWLAGIQAAQRGENLPKLDDFFDELQSKHFEESGLTELWESRGRPDVIEVVQDEVQWWRESRGDSDGSESEVDSGCVRMHTWRGDRYPSFLR